MPFVFQYSPNLGEASHKSWLHNNSSNAITLSRIFMSTLSTIWKNIQKFWCVSRNEVHNDGLHNLNISKIIMFTHIVKSNLGISCTKLGFNASGFLCWVINVNWWFFWTWRTYFSLILPVVINQMYKLLWTNMSKRLK
jgi:hypothetical protein